MCPIGKHVKWTVVHQINYKGNNVVKGPKGHNQVFLSAPKGLGLPWTVITFEMFPNTT